MARREPMKVRTLRVGDEWDEALKIAQSRGDDLPAYLRRAIALYIELAGPKQPPTD